MAKQTQEPEAEVLDTPEIDEVEQPEAEVEQSDDAPEAEAPEPEAESDEEETIIGFGDEEEDEHSAEDETPTIKRLRERNREQTRLLREREKRISELEQTAKPKIELGPKPDLWEDCEGDPEVFEAKLDIWKTQKAEAESAEETKNQQMAAAMQSYDRDLDNYNTRKASIGVPDFEEAEAVVVAALNMEQQAVALQAANDPAALVVALSRSPAKLAELAKIDNPWKLSAAIAKLEGSVKVVTRKKGPNLDRPARGSASMAQVNADEKLAQLEKEAEKTGNRTELIAYKRSLKAK